MSAAKEWAASGIRVNSVCFGVVETPMTEVIRSEKFRDRMMAQVPMGRFADDTEIAAAVAFLASDDSSFITASNFLVDGGISGAYVTPLDM